MRDVSILGQVRPPKLRSRQVTVQQELVYLGLGSNLGDRAANLRVGLDGLQEGGLRLLALSSLYVTEPDLGDGRRTPATAGDDACGQAAATRAPDAGEGEHPWYLNCAAAFADAPAPHRLLALCLQVERRAGRERPAGPNGGPPRPRTLDIDVLLVGERVIDEPGLSVPHPRLAERRFALQPLCEIAPHARHPVSGASIEELLGHLPPGPRVTRLQPQPRGSG